MKKLISSTLTVATMSMCCSTWDARATSKEGIPSTKGYTTYSSIAFGFMVNFPKDWKGLYEVRVFSPQGGNAIEVFDFNYRPEKTRPVILELVSYPKSYLGHLKKDPVVIKAFSNSEFAFAFYGRTEYPYPNDNKYKEFKHLESQLPWIVSHFIVHEDVDAKL